MSCVCVCQLLHFVKKNNNNIEKTKKITNISVRFEREVRDGVHSEQSLVFKLKKKKKTFMQIEVLFVVHVVLLLLLLI